jgi:hypothetical protein
MFRMPGVMFHCGDVRRPLACLEIYPKISQVRGVGWDILFCGAVFFDRVLEHRESPFALVGERGSMIQYRITTKKPSPSNNCSRHEGFCDRLRVKNWNSQKYF